MFSMSNAPAAKLSIDPLEAAFDEAPWDERAATEEEAEAMRVARAAEAEGAARFVAGPEVTASIAEPIPDGR
jgi:hypothetical protein